MKTKLNKMRVSVTDIKFDSETGRFTCYGNTKSKVDHALDKTMDGAYVDSIKAHQEAGSMPDMFWMHKSHEFPVGVWLKMEEDSHGLKMTGQLAVGKFSTPEGERIHSLAKLKALKEFSIGYYVEDEEWNNAGGYNELRKIHIVEVSWVTKGCNDASLLIDMKTALGDDVLPTKRELQNLLREELGFSKRQAEKIIDKYDPDAPKETINLDIDDLTKTINNFLNKV